ncbi:Holliday junction branch migration protein RuvA [Brumimicrobium salinarum]|uniref:Holliday junction branch migration complex subunit RuvA n=1 Tax=Brumimicrobium salinarum TaxID=2058658 RepID=A0A2I0R6F7_9FLAO|nr:Holliday junction branch migration protein RuvA [Brumimicrobium salinarum]PKR82154.1 Holliday junction branch migration protein RuvA [Brumimicrobium salinarum]
MITYLNGRLIEKTPTHIIVECGGIGYDVRISLNTFSAISDEESIKIFTQFVVREDAQILYGFKDIEEREMFNLLVSVSGIGPNTGILMLSGLTPSEIANAITSEDVATIKGVKGIGNKTAQRIIVDLKDKMLKFEVSDENVATQNNTLRFDALTALVSLGFDKKSAEKALKKVIKEQDTVELLIRDALKVL